MKKQNKTTPTTKKNAEEQVSRKLTPSELDYISGGEVIDEVGANNFLAF